MLIPLIVGLAASAHCSPRAAEGRTRASSSSSGGRLLSDDVWERDLTKEDIITNTTTVMWFDRCWCDEMYTRMQRLLHTMFVNYGIHMATYSKFVLFMGECEGRKKSVAKKGLIMLQLLLLLPQIFEQLCWELLLCLFNFYHLYYDKTYLKQAVCWLLFNAYAAWLYNILLFWLFRTTTTLNWAGTTCLSELSKTICWNCLRTLIIIIAHDIMHMSKKRTNPNSR